MTRNELDAIKARFGSFVAELAMQVGTDTVNREAFWDGFLATMTDMTDLIAEVDRRLGPPNPWVPLDPDRLPPTTYPQWRAAQE